jgi:hypothetical protein
VQLPWAMRLLALSKSLVLQNQVCAGKRRRNTQSVAMRDLTLMSCEAIGRHQKPATTSERSGLAP